MHIFLMILKANGGETKSLQHLHKNYYKNFYTEASWPGVSAHLRNDEEIP